MCRDGRRGEVGAGGGSVQLRGSRGGDGGAGGGELVFQGRRRPHVGRGGSLRVGVGDGDEGGGGGEGVEEVRGWVDLAVLGEELAEAGAGLADERRELAGGLWLDGYPTGETETGGFDERGLEAVRHQGFRFGLLAEDGAHRHGFFFGHGGHFGGLGSGFCGLWAA